MKSTSFLLLGFLLLASTQAFAVSSTPTPPPAKPTPTPTPVPPVSCNNNCANLNATKGLLGAYTVYTSQGIQAECGDYRGKTASGGDVALQDFLIQSQSNDNSCALESSTSVYLIRGGIENQNNPSCVATPKLDNPTGDTLFDGRTRSTISIPNLNLAMNVFSTLLQNPLANSDLHRVNLEDSYNHNGQIELTGDATSLVIVTSLQTSVSIVQTGINLVGDLGPKNIIWNFPNAQTIRIANSGMDPYGIPGTLVAPNAVITFNDARVTGAIYAKKLIGHAENPGICTGSTAGQVNYAPFQMFLNSCNCGSWKL